MSIAWVFLAACAIGCASADRGGSSLRGALEALQRRQRGRVSPIPSQQDYDALYEILPSEAYTDYVADVEDLDEEQPSKYILKLLEENDRRPESYEYRLKRKDSYHDRSSVSGKESAFRERSHHSDNDRLRDLFTDNDETEEKQEKFRELVDNDAEYALLLSQLWSKYKSRKSNNIESAPQGVVKLYKEKIVKKRMPDNWGPIAFKKKRSSGPEEAPVLPEYETESKHDIIDDPNYNAYEVTDDKDDMREEYALAFQPLDDEGLVDLSNDDQYSFDTVEKRFSVAKRSTNPYKTNIQKKRSTQTQNKRETSKRFRSSSGTDPKVIKDLATIFGESDVKKSPVKRSSNDDENSHENLPPYLTSLPYNVTHERNNVTKLTEDSHELHGHNIHHPGISGNEPETMDNHHDRAKYEKPITIKKKSIDWSNYFGIDKKKKKSAHLTNDLNQDRLRKHYYDAFNKEVIYPLNSFRKHSYVKRNFLSPKSDETEIQIDSARAVAFKKEDKRVSSNSNDVKLDNIDKKLRNMEGLIVDEALLYSNGAEHLDSKEEQETKEKILSRLAAAYSLEKMRKALKEFKQSIQTQKNSPNLRPPKPSDDLKAKRIAVKKEKVEVNSNDIPMFRKGLSKIDDFEEEQGAGHYLNGHVEDQYSEGYMGGSGRHNYPVMSTTGTSGSCPVLARIMQRCHGVDILAGDRGQLFLPLCSLHQICYLCGVTPPTTCDLVFLSEADTTCDGDMGCQQAARSALMALRELHDNLADELDGECEASPCLSATLKLNAGWQRAIQR